MVYFIITVLIVYLFYYIWIIRKYDKDGKLKVRTKTKKGIVIEKEEPKIPSEIQILIIKYKLDMSKINYRGLLKVVGFVCALDIAFITTILSFIKSDNLYLVLGIGAIITIPVILISFSLLGRLFKKKGLVLDEKRDSKKRRKRS